MPLFLVERTFADQLELTGTSSRLATGKPGRHPTPDVVVQGRDARLGRIHPANPLFTHELIGKLSLGINPDEQPRWG